MRIGQLLANDGKFEGEQVLPPGWVRAMATPANPNTPFGYQVWRGKPFYGRRGRVRAVRRQDDLLYLRGHGHDAPVDRAVAEPHRSCASAPRTAASATWDDSRIPNLVIRGARDYVPNAAKPGADISNLVPNH